MIWVIASTPFWIAAGIFTVMGMCGITYGIVKSPEISQSEFSRGIIGGILSLLAGGLLALLAAKICS